MAMTYSEYKTYLLDTLWRAGDTTLTNNLDNLIKLAEKELRSKTADWQRRQQAISIAPTSEDFNLTTGVIGFESVQSVTDNSERGYYGDKHSRVFYQVSPARIYSERANNPGRTMALYAVDTDSVGFKYLRFAADYSVTNPGDLTLLYRGGVPDFETADSSWLEDEYGDLYLYTILKHCAIFVREEERIQLFAQLAQDAFMVADQDEKHNKLFGGSPLKMQPHHRVP